MYEVLRYTVLIHAQVVALILVGVLKVGSAGRQAHKPNDNDRARVKNRLMRKYGKCNSTRGYIAHTSNSNNLELFQNRKLDTSLPEGSRTLWPGAKLSAPLPSPGAGFLVGSFIKLCFIVRDGDGVQFALWHSALSSLGIRFAPRLRLLATGLARPSHRLPGHRSSLGPWAPICIARVVF